jgi:two-component system response regulator MprA
VSADTSHATERRRGETCVLVVDDDHRVREMIRWALEEEGFGVETAADGQQALDRAALRAPALVILDITLPVLDGYGVADRLRATQGERLPILAITADGSAPEKARRVGAYAYLRKPFDVDDLLLKVQVGLRQHPT